MFSTVRYFIKTSIIFLIVGILTGIYMSFNKHLMDEGVLPELISAHTHIILVGSVIMMIMGVALWFFPRAEKNDKRYNPTLLLITYWIMTISTALRFFSTGNKCIRSHKYYRKLNYFFSLIPGYSDNSFLLCNLGKNSCSRQPAPRSPWRKVLTADRIQSYNAGCAATWYCSSFPSGIW